MSISCVLFVSWDSSLEGRGAANRERRDKRRCHCSGQRTVWSRTGLLDSIQWNVVARSASRSVRSCPRPTTTHLATSLASFRLVNAVVTRWHRIEPWRELV